MSDKITSILLGFMVFVLVASVSLLLECGIIKLLCWCFGWAFSWKIAIGIWIILFAVNRFISGLKE